MDDRVKGLLRKLYIDNGQELFDDRKRLQAYLSDILSEYRTEQKRLSLAIGEGIVSRMIHEITEDDLEKTRAFVLKLSDEYACSDIIAKEIVGAFVYAIFGKDVFANEETVSVELVNKTVLNSANKASEESGFEAVNIDYDKSDFRIEGTVLKKYLWNDSVVYIPQGVTEIGKEAFSNCEYIKEIHLPNTVKKINMWAFRDCKNLEYIELSDFVYEICGGAFERCVRLKSIDTRRCEILGHSVFSECSSLESVIFRDEIKQIGTHVLDGTAYFINRNNWKDGYLYVGNHLIRAFDNSVINCNDEVEAFVRKGTITIAGGAFEKTNVTGIHIPYGVKSIPYLMSARCAKLKEISIPDSVTLIDDNAFRECTSIERINIPDGLVKIGCSFSGCKNLKRIRIPEKIDEIVNRTFHNCTNLSSITLPKTVKKIGWHVFDTTAFYNDILNWENGLLYLDNYLICGNDSLQTTGDTVRIKEGTTVIASCAFQENNELYNVVIPSGVKEIPLGAFRKCLHLYNVMLPKSIERIDKEAFLGCKSLNKISISDGVHIIESFAFAECGTLTISIPNSVEKIEVSSFRNTDVTIICDDNSYALSYAIKNNINYRIGFTQSIGLNTQANRLTDAKSWDNNLVDSNEVFSLDVKNVYSITGRGTVVEGIITTGTLKVSDRLSINGKVGTVYGIEKFRKIIDVASKKDGYIGVFVRGITKDDVLIGIRIFKYEEQTTNVNKCNHSNSVTPQSESKEPASAKAKFIRIKPEVAIIINENNTKLQCGLLRSILKYFSLFSEDKFLYKLRLDNLNTVIDMKSSPMIDAGFETENRKYGVVFGGKASGLVLCVDMSNNDWKQFIVGNAKKYKYYSDDKSYLGVIVAIESTVEEGNEFREYEEMLVRDTLNECGLRGYDYPIFFCKPHEILSSDNIADYSSIKQILDAIDSYIPTPERMV